MCPWGTILRQGRDVHPFPGLKHLKDSHQLSTENDMYRSLSHRQSGDLSRGQSGVSNLEHMISGHWSILTEIGSDIEDSTVSGMWHKNSPI